MCLFALAGCATKKEMAPIGGSKADGTVRMGYTFGAFEKPVVDLNNGAIQAAAKCKTWGYTGAEAFGGQTQTCQETDTAGGCQVTNVTVEYQCTGGPAAQH
ncbi:YecR family lipoprotein [Shimwellia pseudoproteus]|uniref:YecR family lipoprotein n=1 Tax=Shimwellia pseudoproteus TaxID=570012 RepID=UPI001E3F3B2B|nr:YecR family lipoprotein [Shimwellia pseudoproteus]